MEMAAKLAQDPLDLVSDPREAAVTMMVAMAQHDGAMTERERTTILREAVERFGASAKRPRIARARPFPDARDP